MNSNSRATLERWHDFVKNPDAAILSEILADDAQFSSPFVWKPKGKKFAVLIITTVTEVFEDFRYTREAFGENFAVLEFAARVGTVELQGVDLIEFNDAGKIKDFKVMIRPANGLQALGEEMGRRMTAKGFTA